MFPKYKGDYYGSFVFEDAKELVKKGFEVHVVTQHNVGIPYEEIMEGVHIHRFKWSEPKEFKALLHFKGLADNLRLITYLISLFINLIRVARKYDVDILHAHSVIPTGFVSVIVSKIVGKPVFITAHGLDITSFENRYFYEKLLSFSLRNCDKIIVVSEFLARAVSSLNIRENIIILRNAVDTNRFKPSRNYDLRNKYEIKDEDVLILFVGYLDTFKGIFELLNAFFELKKLNNNAKLMIAGTGPKEEELNLTISELGLEDSVVLTGKIPPSNIHLYYQSADIFVLPSYTDAGGPPLVFIEAMACGLPVVGTGVGGIPEGIDEGVNGFIVPPKNVAELVKKLNVLVKDSDLREEFGNNSLKKIKANSMTLNKKVERLIQIYHDQIKNH